MFSVKQSFWWMVSELKQESGEGSEAMYRVIGTGPEKTVCVEEKREANQVVQTHRDRAGWQMWYQLWADEEKTVAIWAELCRKGNQCVLL